jgi:hypothetical protein
MMSGVAERYTINRLGMVSRVATKGRNTSAKTVQTSQVFSQAHFRVYFMGIVKLPFAMPATMRVAIPLEVLLMINVPSVPAYAAIDIDYFTAISITFESASV